MLYITTEIRRAFLDAKEVSIHNKQGKGSIKIILKNGASLTFCFEALDRKQNAQWHESYAHHSETEWQIVKQIIRKNDSINFSFMTNYYQNQHERQLNIDHDTLSLLVVRGSTKFIVPVSHQVIPKSVIPGARMVVAA